MKGDKARVGEVEKEEGEEERKEEAAAHGMVKEVEERVAR